MTEFPASLFGSGVSLAYLVGVPALLLTIFAVSLWRTLVHVRLARAARAEASAAPPLVRGPAILVGRVRAPSAEPVVQLTIQQDGTDHGRRGQPQHTWTESSRQTSVKPFVLELEDGSQVRVVPTERIAFLDTLELLRAPDARATRTITARLSRGDRVYVEGELALEPATDPKAAPVWTLRPGRPAMLVSTEAPDARHERRLTFWLPSALFAFLIGMTFVTLTWLHDWPLLLSPVCVQAEVTALPHWVTHSRRGGTHYHWAVEGRITSACDERQDLDWLPARGLEIEGELAWSSWRQLHLGDRIPVTMSRSRPSVYVLGLTEGAVEPVELQLTLLCLALLLAGLYALHRRSLAWYEKRRVTHTGVGTLAESTLGEPR